VRVNSTKSRRAKGRRAQPFTAVQSNICARNYESRQVTRTTIAYTLLSLPPPLLLLLLLNNDDDEDEDGARRVAETAVTRCLVSRVNVSCPLLDEASRGTQCGQRDRDGIRLGALWTSWHG